MVLEAVFLAEAPLVECGRGRLRYFCFDIPQSLLRWKHPSPCSRVLGKSVDS